MSFTITPWLEDYIRSGFGIEIEDNHKNNVTPKKYVIIDQIRENSEFGMPTESGIQICLNDTKHCIIAKFSPLFRKNNKDKLRINMVMELKKMEIKITGSFKKVYFVVLRYSFPSTIPYLFPFNNIISINKTLSIYHCLLKYRTCSFLPKTAIKNKRNNVEIKENDIDDNDYMDDGYNDNLFDWVHNLWPNKHDIPEKFKDENTSKPISKPFNYKLVETQSKQQNVSFINGGNNKMSNINIPIFEGHKSSKSPLQQIDFSKYDLSELCEEEESDGNEVNVENNDLSQIQSDGININKNKKDENDGNNNNDEINMERKQDIGGNHENDENVMDINTNPLDTNYLGLINRNDLDQIHQYLIKCAVGLRPSNNNNKNNKLISE